MEKSLSKESKITAISKLAAYGLAGATALMAATSCFAAYTASGVVFTAALVTGAKAGLGDSVSTIQTTLDNSFLIETALLFLGLAVVIGVIMFVIKGHRRI